MAIVGCAQRAANSVWFINHFAIKHREICYSKRIDCIECDMRAARMLRPDCSRCMHIFVSHSFGQTNAIFTFFFLRVFGMAKIIPLFTDERNERKIQGTRERERNVKNAQNKRRYDFFSLGRAFRLRKKYLFPNEKNGRWMMV